MTAINEAYARIDYAYLKSIESRINKLEEEVNKLNSAVDSIGGEDTKASNKRFVSRRITLNKNKSSEKVNFSPEFPAKPTVVFSVEDDTVTGRVVVVTELTAKYVKFNVLTLTNAGVKGDQGSTKGSYTVNMLAIGKAE